MFSSISLSALILGSLYAEAASTKSHGGSSSKITHIETLVPEYHTDHAEMYLCTSVLLPDEPLKLVGVEPLSKQEVVHHMLLFGMLLSFPPVPCPACLGASASPLCRHVNFMLGTVHVVAMQDARSQQLQTGYGTATHTACARRRAATCCTAGRRAPRPCTSLLALASGWGRALGAPISCSRCACQSVHRVWTHCTVAVLQA